MHISRTLLATLAVGATAWSSAVPADNLLGLYAGAGVGVSDVRSDDYYVPDYGRYDHDHHTAGKAIIGVRPIPFVGAELEYIDFGHPGGDNDYNDPYYYYGPDSHPRAITAFGVGYLPIAPFFDIFGKAGAARLHTNVNGFDQGNCTYVTYTCVPTNATQSVWNTRFAYGGGLQWKVFGLAVRAEYERINSPFGDPDALTVGATWTF